MSLDESSVKVDSVENQAKLDSVVPVTLYKIVYIEVFQSDASLLNQVFVLGHIADCFFLCDQSKRCQSAVLSLVYIDDSPLNYMFENVEHFFAFLKVCGACETVAVLDDVCLLEFMQAIQAGLYYLRAE